MDSTVALPDLTHHLSKEVRERRPNPMKTIWMLVSSSGRKKVTLANGDPHFSLYPFDSLSLSVPAVMDVEDPVGAWRSGSCPSQNLVTGRMPDGPDTLGLNDGLQYHQGAGMPATQEAVASLTRRLHAPQYDAQTTLTLGNADGVTKVFRLLGDAGDFYLADEFGFCGLVNAPRAYGVKWVPVKMDAQGMIPEELEKILEQWDTSRGRRPHVLYLVPNGQNPTGTTLPLQRRRQIYDIAERYDIIIMEDDPYYYLQYDIPGAKAGTSSSKELPKFIPSFLSIDVSGRVVRLDSFSKILAPGLRLGWITSNSTFHQALVSYTDSATQHPHGFGQALIAQLLAEPPRGWGHAGLDRWVRSLCLDYRARRDYFLEVFTREVPAHCARAEVPQAGMFVWSEVLLGNHPRFIKDSEGKTNTAVLMEELFTRLLDADLVVMPASQFVTPGEPWMPYSADIEDRCNFFRMTFAGTEDTIDTGVTIFGRTITAFFT